MNDIIFNKVKDNILINRESINRDMQMCLRQKVLDVDYNELKYIIDISKDILVYTNISLDIVEFVNEYMNKELFVELDVFNEKLDDIIKSNNMHIKNVFESQEETLNKEDTEKYINYVAMSKKEIIKIYEYKYKYQVVLIEYIKQLIEYYPFIFRSFNKNNKQESFFYEIEKDVSIIINIFIELEDTSQITMDNIDNLDKYNNYDNKK